MSADLDLARLRSLVPSLAGHQLIVLGDLLLDEYLFGRPTRLSREAPIPVLEFSRRFCRVGGAGNPAVNIRALGSSAHLIGVAGDDPAREALIEELGRAGLEPSGILVQAGARTATKTRLLAEDSSSRQHVARLDYPAPPPDAATRAALAARLRQAVADLTPAALVLSNYQGGVVDEASIAQARDLGHRHGCLTAADSQGGLSRFTGLDLVKCNLAEAEATAGRSLTSLAAIEQAGSELLTALETRFVVVTRGAEGVSAFERGRPPVHLSAANRTEVFDVTGAGDTAIAVLTLALVAGASLVEAAELANIAAGLVVKRLGVATVSPAELLAAIGDRTEEQREGLTEG